MAGSLLESENYGTDSGNGVGIFFRSLRLSGMLVNG